MRKLILAAAAVVALSFATSTAMADHYRHYGSYHHRGYVPRYAVPHHTYRYAPVYPGRLLVYPQPYYAPVPGYGYGYGYPGHARGGIGVNGGNFSFYYGF